MKNLFKLCVVSLSLILCGCLTLSHVWKYEPNPEGQIVYEPFAKDTVRAFGKTQTKGNEQLVMMGDTYWYFIDAKDTEKLLKVLNTRLPKPFSSNRKAFNVKLPDGSKSFYSSFQLYYEIQNSKEKAILEELGFVTLEYNPKLYVKSYLVHGEIYQKSGSVTPNYQFDTALPINIEVGKKLGASGTGLPIKIAATPISLAVDTAIIGLSILTLPFQLLAE